MKLRKMSNFIITIPIISLIFSFFGFAWWVGGNSLSGWDSWGDEDGEGGGPTMLGRWGGGEERGI